MMSRIEEDFIGTKKIDDSVLYGLQALRASENFGQIGGIVNWKIIDAIVTVKKAAALSYRKLGLSCWPSQAEGVFRENGRDGMLYRFFEERKITSEMVWTAVIDACDRLLSGGESSYRDQFPIAALQGGAGTSTNMNVNEVLANLALHILNIPGGKYEIVDPLDTINKGQSTNDVYPAALRIAVIRQIRKLSAECASLQEALQKKEQEFSDVRKLGRTEMMDAMEITLGEELGAFAQAIGRDRWRIYKIEERLRQVALGGTAVGTGANANRKYTFLVMDYLRELSDIGLAKAEYPIDITQNQDVFVEVSALLKALAVNLLKISGDLRLMASGPNGGLGEITLPKLQKGSTIMPGKVNPVIPEMVTQAALRAVAHDTEITMAASIGNLELNAFLPLIADALLDSTEVLIDACHRLRTECIDGLKANAERCRELLDSANIQATLKVPEVGYAAAEKEAVSRK